MPSIADLFVHTLRDIYYAEKQIVQVLPEVIDRASDPQLKTLHGKRLAATHANENYCFE